MRSQIFQPMQQLRGQFCCKSQGVPPRNQPRFWARTNDSSKRSGSCAFAIWVVFTLGTISGCPFGFPLDTQSSRHVFAFEVAAAFAEQLLEQLANSSAPVVLQQDTAFGLVTAGGRDGLSAETCARMRKCANRACMHGKMRAVSITCVWTPRTRAAVLNKCHWDMANLPLHKLHGIHQLVFIVRRCRVVLVLAGYICHPLSCFSGGCYICGSRWKRCNH